MQNAPVILAIDTALGACSAAIVQGGVILGESEEPVPGRQSRVLVPMIESLLEKAGLAYKDMGAIACTLGPGGFTGIRVGLATARAIALAAGKPMIGVSTLETIAWGAKIEGDVLAVIDARRGQFYAQRFRRNGALVAQSEPLLVESRMLPSLGHGAKTVQAPTHARDAAGLAAAKWASGERDFPATPLYIREPDAKLPQKQGLKCAS